MSNTQPIDFNAPPYVPNKYYVPVEYPYVFTPRPATDEYGNVLPGNDSFLDRDTKKRLNELLVEGATYTTKAYGSLLASNVQRVSTKQNKGKPIDRSLVGGNTPSTANEILAKLTSDRQTLIIFGAIVVFVVMMFVARKG